MPDRENHEKTQKSPKIDKITKIAVLTSRKEGHFLQTRCEALMEYGVSHNLGAGLGTNLRIYLGNQGGCGFNMRIFLRNLGAGLST